MCQDHLPEVKPRSPSDKHFFHLRYGIALSGALFLGLGLRLLCTFELATFLPGYFDPPPATDMHVYHHLALGLLENPWGEGPLFWNPLYYHLLALLYAFFGPHKLLVVFAQILLGLGTVLLTARLASRLGGTVAGIIAAYATACCGQLILFEQFLLLETLQTFLLVLFLNVAVQSEAPGRARHVGLGVLFGLLVLARSNIFLFLPAVLAWQGWRLLQAGYRRPTVFVCLCAFALGSLLAVVPVTGRNAIVLGRFVPLTTNFGETFYLGNYRHANGLQAFPTEFLDLQRHARTLPPDEEQAFWLGLTRASYRGDYSSLPGLLLRKVALFWGSWEIPNNISLQICQLHAQVLRLPLMDYTLFGFLGLAVLLYLGCRRRPEPTVLLLLLLLATYTISVLILMIHGRFRLPLYPVLLAAAASSPTLLSGILRDRRALLRFLLLCLFFALLLNVGLGEATFADLPLHGFPAWVRY